uniref:Uncharacterized protein n=1 Tax=Globodera rostochiensis TaxID=31243 RepID=A0A914HQM3_GLORO
MKNIFAFLVKTWPPVRRPTTRKKCLHKPPLLSCQKQNSQRFGILHCLITSPKLFHYEPAHGLQQSTASRRCQCHCGI